LRPQLVQRGGSNDEFRLGRAFTPIPAGQYAVPVPDAPHDQAMTRFYRRVAPALRWRECCTARGQRRFGKGQVMSRSWRPVVALCVLLSGAAGIFAARASALQESADTARLIDTIEKRRHDVTRADLKAAHHLNADGDKAYRRKDYPAAFTAYSNSYPNAPTAYAYIMAGDAHWRSVLQHQTQDAARGRWLGLSFGQQSFRT
jgi:hypothetical protein